MRRQTIITVIMAVAMVTSLAVAGAAAQTNTSSTAQADANAHGGSHVEFETTDTAVVDYRVDGAGVVSSVEVESAADAEQRLGLDVSAELSAVTQVQGSAVSTEAESETRVSMTTESGAAIDAHDSIHGQLVISAEGEGQLVGVDLTGEATAEQAGDARVVVTHDDGTQGTFIVIGDGEVTVNDEGDVTAHLEGDAKLTYRQYAERSDEDEAHERLIADGTAAAEVYLSAAADGEAAADVVSYAEDTTVEVVTHSENEIVATAERTESEGKIVIMSLSEAAFETADGVTVEVDGEAAVEAQSTSELEAAAAGGDDPAFMVQQATTASAGAEVLVALNHFSEREFAVASGGDAPNGDNGGADTPADDDDGASMIPGFGAAIAGVALAIAALVAVRRR